MQIFDMRTMAIYSSLISLVLALSMVFFSYRRKIFHGIVSWIFAECTASAGLFLMSLRDILPSFVSIMIANTLIMASYILISIGIDHFLHKKTRLWIIHLLILATMQLLFYHFTYHKPSVNWRIIVYSFTAASLYGSIYLSSIRSLRKFFPERTAILSFLFLVSMSWYMIRGVYTYLLKVQITDYMAAGLVEQMTFIITILGSNMIMILLIILTSERFRKDLIKANDALQKALSEVKVLRGIIPICYVCKKVRNDEGYYEAVEAYISRQSEADFSHTLCPDCLKEQYPEVYNEIHLKDQEKDL